LWKCLPNYSISIFKNFLGGVCPQFQDILGGRPVSHTFLLPPLLLNPKSASKVHLPETPFLI